jgi:hypothetical protein
VPKPANKTDFFSQCIPPSAQIKVRDTRMLLFPESKKLPEEKNEKIPKNFQKALAIFRQLCYKNNSNYYYL